MNVKKVKNMLLRSVSLLLVLCMVSGLCVTALAEETEGGVKTEAEVTDEVTDEPIEDKPIADEPIEDEQIADEPITDEPSADIPTEAAAGIAIEADAGVAAAAEDAGSSFTAVLYPNGEGTGEGVELTAEGNNTINLDETANMLVIKWNYNQITTNTLEITVPAGMYILENRTLAGEGIESVEFTPLDLEPSTDGLQQGVGTYFNEKTGTLQYTGVCSETDISKEVTIKLFITFDKGIWGATANSQENPVVVTMDGNEETAKTVGTATTDYFDTISYDMMAVFSSSNVSAEKTITGYSYLRQLPADNETLNSYKNITYTFTTSVLRSGKDTGIKVPIKSVTFPRQTRNDIVMQTVSGQENVAKVSIDDFEFYFGSTGDSYNTFVLDLNSSLGLQGGDQIKLSISAVGELYMGGNISCASNLVFTLPVEGVDFEVLKPMSARMVPSENFGWYQEAPDNVVDPLGVIGYVNNGSETATNIPIKIEYDSATNMKMSPNMKVYGTNLPLPSGQSTTVKVILVDDNGIYEGPYEFTGKNTASATGYSNLWISAKKIADENKLQGNWYLKQLEYTVSKLESKKKTSHLEYQRTTGGVYLGRLSGDSANTTLWINDNISGTLVTSKISSPTHAMRINDVTDMKISGDETISYSFKLASQVIPYAYTHTMWNSKPTVIFVAPKGITVEAAAWGDDKKQITVPAPRVDGNDNNIYRLELGEGAALGYYYDNTTSLQQFNTDGYQVTLTLKGAANLGHTVIELRDRLMISNTYNGNLMNYSGSTLYECPDNFDVNNNNNKTEKFGTYSNSVGNVTIITTPLTNVLTLDSGISLDGGKTYANGSRFDRELTVETAEPFLYRVRVSNDTGKVVPKGNTAIYIPIPKEGEKLPDSMGGVTPVYSMTITRAIKDDSGLWDIRYSTDATAENYCNNTYTFTGDANWKTADQMTEEDWDKVTFIKVVIAGEESSYPADTNSDLILEMQTVPTQLSEEASKYIIWSSAQWNQYDNNGDDHEGAGVVQSTAYNRVKVGVNESAYEVSVTAGGEEGKNMAAIILPDKGSLRFSVTEVQAVNMDLVTKETIAADPDISVPEQDRSFALDVQLGENALVQLADAVQTVKALGSTSENAETDLQFTVSAYQNHVDVTTIRYVEVELWDSLNAFHITVRININRTLTAAKAETGIVGGKYYRNIGTAMKTVITENSAFTASFALMSYIPTNYEGEPKLVFTGTIPEGIPLLLIDLPTNTETETNPAYYSYTTTGAASIRLSDFTSMEGDSSFSIGSGSVSVDKNLILVADFTKVNLSMGDYTLTLQAAINGKEPDDLIEKPLDIEVIEKRSFDFEKDSAMGNSLHSEMTLAYQLTSSVGTGTDYLWQNKGQAIYFTLNDENGAVVDFPAGSYISYGNDTYTPLSNGKAILVPLGNLLPERAVQMKIHTPYQKLTDGNYTLVAENWVSATAEASAPMGGRNVGAVETSFTVDNDSLKNALKISFGENQDRLVTVSEAKNGFEISIERNERLAGTALTLSVEKKVGDGYVPCTALKSESSISADASTATVKLDASRGTYRFVLKADGGSAETNLSFIITE